MNIYIDEVLKKNEVFQVFEIFEIFSGFEILDFFSKVTFYCLDNCRNQENAVLTHIKYTNIQM